MIDATAAWALAGALLGAIAGSFLATLAIRWLGGRSIARGRSRCDGCGAVLRAWELVPLAGWLAVRGRCRRCGVAIDLRHPAMELACTAIGAASCAVAPGWPGLAGALFGWLLATLALLDAERFWLPDALVLPLGVAGLAFGLPPLGNRLIGTAAGWLVLAMTAALYRRARGHVGLGRGDAKLLAAIGAWLGWRALPWVVFAACALGLAWVATATLTGRRMSATTPLPLGTLLAAAAWPAWLLASA